jgi:hypothetical protein
MRALSGILAILFVWTIFNSDHSVAPTVVLSAFGVLFAAFAIFGRTAADRIEALFSANPDNSGPK